MDFPTFTSISFCWLLRYIFTLISRCQIDVRQMWNGPSEARPNGKQGTMLKQYCLLPYCTTKLPYHNELAYCATVRQSSSFSCSLILFFLSTQSICYFFRRKSSTILNSLLFLLQCGSWYVEISLLILTIVKHSVNQQIYLSLTSILEFSLIFSCYLKLLF